MTEHAVQTIPILPSSNFDRTSAFFSALGFAEAGRWPGEYLILRRDAGLELHFWHNPGVKAGSNDVACYVRFGSATEAQRLYDDWSRAELGGGRLQRPTSTDYGLLEFALIDPDGNLLRIGGRIGAGQ